MEARLLAKCQRYFRFLVGLVFGNTFCSTFLYFFHFFEGQTIHFSNFSCMFLNPNIFFSNLNSNCSNLLAMRNLQEQVKKAFCYQKLFWPFTVWINCSSDWEKFWNSRLKVENLKRSEKILVTECFLTCFRRFLISNKLEELEFKLEKKILGFRNMQEKLEKKMTSSTKVCLFMLHFVWCWAKKEPKKASLALP